MIFLEIHLLNIDDIKPYENNPRKNDKAIEPVAKSIKEYGFRVPIVIDKNNVIVAGHARYKACKQLGIDKVPCVIADDLNEDQIKAYRIADNKTAEYAEWDFELLEIELNDIELDTDWLEFDFEDEKEIPPSNLKDDFIVPPVSILDTRQGYWQDRKDEWKALGLDSSIGRDDELLGKGLKQLAQKSGSNLTGTSIFDPVLCEIMYKWFNIYQGRIFDPFAGGSVRGIIASKLGYEYLGIDLRQEQVEANYKNAEDLNVNPIWICDDSLNADEHLNDESVDMIFSCPPYADLEVYSDDPKDLSTMEYDKFKQVYKEIIDIACRKLKQDRFAVFVVGDVRDKKGAYRNFVDYTKQCFNENGLVTYNEIILLEQIATACMRARRIFNTRKVVKTHQNVLVFYKGDIKRIRQNYSVIDVMIEGE